MQKNNQKVQETIEEEVKARACIWTSGQLYTVASLRRWKAVCFLSHENSGRWKHASPDQSLKSDSEKKALFALGSETKESLNPKCPCTK